MNRFIRPIALSLFLFLAAGLVGCGGSSAPAADPVSVQFVSPIDGATVTSPVAVEMAVTGVSLARAGTMEPGSGHLHIMINADFVDPGVIIRADSLHRHFGDASTTTQLELPPGEHVLRLQFGDGAHRALEGDQYRHEIRINVTG